jgi:hypothetical protein
VVVDIAMTVIHKPISTGLNAQSSYKPGIHKYCVLRDYNQKLIDSIILKQRWNKEQRYNSLANILRLWKLYYNIRWFRLYLCFYC